MIKRIKIDRVLLILLIASLSINISYLKDNKSKYIFIQDTFVDLHQEFQSTFSSLYKRLYLIKDSGFNDKEYIIDALDEAVYRLRFHDAIMHNIGYLDKEFRDYYYFDLYQYLTELKDKRTFTEEDFQKIREIYMLTTSITGKDIIEIKSLHKLTPTHEFNEMIQKINDLCREAR